MIYSFGDLNDSFSVVNFYYSKLFIAGEACESTRNAEIIVEKFMLFF